TAIAAPSWMRQSDVAASDEMRLTGDCMESSAQIAALELLAASSSVRMLCLLAVLGDTIVFSLLVSREKATPTAAKQCIWTERWRCVPTCRGRKRGLADLVAGEAAVLG